MRGLGLHAGCLRALDECWSLGSTSSPDLRHGGETGPLNWVSWGPRGLWQHLQEIGLDTIQAWLAMPQPLPGRHAGARLAPKRCVCWELCNSQQCPRFRRVRQRDVVQDIWLRTEASAENR